MDANSLIKICDNIWFLNHIQMCYWRDEADLQALYVLGIEEHLLVRLEQY